jgi:hypothetical protein
MIPVTGMKNFAQAILSKLIHEIAGRDAQEPGWGPKTPPQTTPNTTPKTELALLTD